jgi:hypothetical protein
MREREIAKNPNKNGQKQTRLNLREKLRRDCKTFIHRFDSDRRLQSNQQLRVSPQFGEKITVVKIVVSLCRRGPL